MTKIKNPEIIVPSLYGIVVLDYDSGAAGKLSLKWSNSDGKIESSAIIADVDHDNEYEIVYVNQFKNVDGGLRLWKGKINKKISTL